MYNETFPLIIAPIFTDVALWLTSQLAEGRNSVEQKVIVPGAGDYRFIIPARLTNEYPRIYHVMH